jgi:yecA family protein
MEYSVDYGELDRMLARAGAHWGAGQAHGLLCGRLAAGGADARQGWLNQVLEGTDANNALRGEVRPVLEALFDYTYRQLSARQSAFQPLLPEETERVEDRVEGLAHWCEGFLHGLVTSRGAQAHKDKLAAEPLSEIIKDLLQLTRATADPDEDEETNETAYSELVEYVRVSTQLVYEEMAEFRSPGPAEEKTH